MVHWHPVPVANQLLILIIKLASYILTGYNIKYSYYSLSKFGGFGIFAQLRQGHEIEKLHMMAGSKLLKNASIGILIVYFWFLLVFRQNKFRVN